ncbi:hypothetical protein B0H19DRAFT_1055353 [Mycena capillaripes]|nr:hypothetical protein B0H19DRAFT_1055353 [Mycena capillaripes]
MQFANVAIATFLALFAGLFHAAPTTDDLLTVSRVIPVGEYNVTIYTEASGTSLVARAPLDPRACSPNQFICTPNQAASQAICAELLIDINGNPNNILNESPRAVCLGQGAPNQCCVSWLEAVGPMLQGQLYSLRSTPSINASREPSCWVQGRRRTSS